MENLPTKYSAKVIALNQLSASMYELVFERKELVFRAGHEIMIHGQTPHQDRQYSIASGENEEALKVLFRLIPDGELTPQLATLKAGDPLNFTGPFGSFILRDQEAHNIFVATGTGIAPALSFIKTHPKLNLSIYHGVRVIEDLIHQDYFNPEQFYGCISQEKSTDYYMGRVTQKLADQSLDPHAHYYLCGANEMILEVHALLKAKGIADTQLFCEAYYFW